MARLRRREAPDRLPTVEEVAAVSTVDQLCRMRWAVNRSGVDFYASRDLANALVRRLDRLAELDSEVALEVVALARRFDPRGGPRRSTPPEPGTLDAARAGLVRHAWSRSLRLFDDGARPCGPLAALQATTYTDPRRTRR